MDKSLAHTAHEARMLQRAAASDGVVRAVTFNYRFNLIANHIRALIKRGELGDISSRYLQEWLLYETDFSWRLDPTESGEFAIVADAGCHRFDGLLVQSILAELATLVRVRKLGGAREAFSTSDHGPVEANVGDDDGIDMHELISSSGRNSLAALH